MTDISTPPSPDQLRGGPVDPDFVIPADSETYGNLLAYLLRTSQQQLVQMSAMADMKANILITTAAIILTVALARFDDPELRVSLTVLSLSSLLSLVLAVLAVLPKAVSPRSTERFDEEGNLLFFGHFTAMPEDEFIWRMQRVIASNETIVRAQLRDIYQNGAYLQQGKFRYLRYAYISFLTGLILSGITQAVVTFGKLAE
jgi:Pycsar effector protein